MLLLSFFNICEIIPLGNYYKGDGSYKGFINQFMNKVKSMEIPYAKYANEYRQIKRLYSFGDCELIVLKDAVSKNKYVALQKDIGAESESAAILRQIASSLEVFECQGVSRFVGFVNGTVWDNIQVKQIKRIMLIFDYCNKPIQTAITNARQLGKQDGSKLMKSLITKLFDIFVALEANSINLGFLVIDSSMVIINSWGQIDHSVKFIYLPFSFVHEGLLSLKNFNGGIYSSRELESINIKERRGVPGLNTMPKNGEGDLGDRQNRQVLQKMGLFLIKILNELNPQVLMQPELSLYTMNDHFNIDFNWPLLQQFLQQCNKLKGYSSVVKIIRFMIDCKDEQSFSAYRSLLQQNKIYPQKKQGNYNEQTIATLKSIQDRIPAKSELIKYEDGGIYKGCLNNGVRQGYGVYYFSEGQLYGGEWRDDEMTGRGIYLFMNKESYDGEVLAGIKEGTGVYYYHNGDKYSGHWHDDVKQGQGEHLCASTGERYVGMFRKNLKSGQGTIYHLNKHRFQGMFENGLRHGQGSLFDESNRMYLRGCWKNGQVETGQIFLQNGDCYKGELKDNKKNGRGVYKYADDTVYEGDFLNDEQSGQCLIKYPNGDRYEGKIHKGQFQGRGKYKYHNSELVYEGNWKNGVADGQGSFFYCEEIKLSAVMGKGELVSYSINTMQMGDILPLFNDSKLTII